MSDVLRIECPRNPQAIKRVELGYFGINLDGLKVKKIEFIIEPNDRPRLKVHHVDGHIDYLEAPAVSPQVKRSAPPPPAEEARRIGKDA